MVEKLIGYALAQLIKQVDRDALIEALDAFFDKIEDKLKVEPDNIKKTAIQTGINIVRKLLAYDDKDFGTDKQAGN